MTLNKNVKLNKYHVNAALKSHILSNEDMKNYGFRYVRNYNSWYYTHTIYDLDISFNVTIYVDNQDEPNIEVLDECFCQPYDYQYILSRDPKFKVALIVKDFVEEQMAKLQTAGIISGFTKGMYI